MIDGLVEHDQILVPTSSGVRVFPLLQLMRIDKSMLSAYAGFGMPPIRFITQRGPFQDGETPLDMRYDARVIQIVVIEPLYNATQYGDRRWLLTDLIRPSRSFSTASGVTTSIYRRWMPGGKVERGTDMSVVAGDALVTSARGKFVHNGLRAGLSIELTSVPSTHTVSQVLSDYAIRITPAPLATAADVHWRYVRGQSFRDLNCLLELVPTFDRNSASPNKPLYAGYVEALRFICHDPFWYGEEQAQAWTLPDFFADLTFDYPSVACEQAGAWFGATANVGRWIFATDYVGEIAEITYWGHEATFPTIVIDGPAETPVITNVTTGVVLSLAYDVALGETVTLDIQDLTVTNNAGDNLFRYLAGDLATFALQAEPQAPGRINRISVSYSGGTADSSATLYWRNKYASI